MPELDKFDEILIRMEESIDEFERKIIEIISGSAECVSDNNETTDELKNNSESVADLEQDSVNAHYALEVLLVNGIEWMQQEKFQTVYADFSKQKKQQENLQTTYSDLSKKLGIVRPSPACLSKFNPFSKADFERDRRRLQFSSWR